MSEGNADEVKSERRAIRLEIEDHDEQLATSARALIESRNALSEHLTHASHQMENLDNQVGSILLTQPNGTALIDKNALDQLEKRVKSQIDESVRALERSKRIEEELEVEMQNSEQRALVFLTRLLTPLSETKKSMLIATGGAFTISIGSALFIQRKRGKRMSAGITALSALTAIAAAAVITLVYFRGRSRADEVDDG